MQLDAHPLAEIYPDMTPEEYDELVQQIGANGLIEPIVLLDGLILDGRHRFRAVMELRANGTDIEPRFVPFEGDDPAAFIQAKHTRRSMTTTQKACVALKWKVFYQSETKQGQRTDLTSDNNTRSSEAPDDRTARAKAARQVGVSPSVVDKAARIHREAPRLYEDMFSGIKTVWDAERELNSIARDARRSENRAIVASAPTIEQKIQAKFATILIDPPWDFAEEGDKEVFGRTNPTYATMTDDEIAALPVGRFADEDCHLYMWITNRSLLTGKGARLLEAWGFRFITVITWCKPSIGVGNYFRNNTEHLVFGVKGKQSVRRHDVGTWFQAPRGKGGHSSKPIESYELIESCSPGPYLEIFARSERADWTAWGEITATEQQEAA